MIRGDDMRRFLSKVDKTETCWLWTGWKTGEYGRFTVSKRHWLAHRWLYEQTVGPVPADLQLDHLCRVRGCVRPDHLEVVTNTENARRGEVGSNMRAKTECAQGHPFTPENTGTSSRGWRFCRTCKRLSQAKINARRRADADVHPSPSLPSPSR